MGALKKRPLPRRSQGNNRTLFDLDTRPENHFLPNEPIFTVNLPSRNRRFCLNPVSGVKHFPVLVLVDADVIVSNARGLANALGVPIEEFVGDEDPES